MMSVIAETFSILIALLLLTLSVLVQCCKQKKESQSKSADGAGHNGGAGPQISSAREKTVRDLKGKPMAEAWNLQKEKEATASDTDLDLIEEDNPLARKNLDKGKSKEKRKKSMSKEARSRERRVLKAELDKDGIKIQQVIPMPLLRQDEKQNVSQYAVVKQRSSFDGIAAPKAK